jgi:hypothetical protein
MILSAGPGAWLRRQREDRSWSRAEMARRLIQAATDDTGDTTMPSAVNIARHRPLGTRSLQVV